MEVVITPTNSDSIMNVATVIKTRKKRGARILRPVPVQMWEGRAGPGSSRTSQ